MTHRLAIEIAARVEKARRCAHPTSSQSADREYLVCDDCGQIIAWQRGPMTIRLNAIGYGAFLKIQAYVWGNWKGTGTNPALHLAEFAGALGRLYPLEEMTNG